MGIPHLVRAVRRSVRIGILTLAAGTFAALLASSVGASPVIDQAYVLPAGSGAGSAAVGGPDKAAQTFTVGLAGNLTGADVGVLLIGNATTTGTVTIELRPATAGGPVNSVLRSVQMPIASFPYATAPSNALTHVDFGANPLPVTAGELLTLDVAYAGSVNSNVVWLDNYVQPYAGGRAYNTGGPGDAWAALQQVNGQTQSFFFQTYVDPAASSVPLPPGALLALPTVLGLLAVRHTAGRRGRGRMSAIPMA